MRFLIDECLAPLVATSLTQAGHDAVHVSDLGLLARPDVELMEAARKDRRVLVSADTDFGELLATSGERLPSVILLRRTHEPADQCAAILAALPDVRESLADGSIVVVTSDRIRIRALPIEPDRRR